MPLTLATADLDGDGVADLLAGYGTGQAGSLVLYRGNVAALWPYGEALRAEPPAPFLPQPATLSVPQQPDFLLTGDFDGDGLRDILAGQSGSTTLWLLRALGHGHFAAPRALPLPGPLTAVAADPGPGLPSLAVGIATSTGAKVLLYSAAPAAPGTTPQLFSLPHPVTDLAFARLDGNPTANLAIAAGDTLAVVHPSKGSHGAATLTTQTMPFHVQAIVAGDFSSAGTGLAALDANGTVHMLQHTVAAGSVLARLPAAAAQGFAPARGSAKQPVAASRPGNAQGRAAAIAHAQSNAGEWTEESTVALPGGFAQRTPRLLAGYVTGARTQDLLLPDTGNGRVHVLSSHPAMQLATSLAPGSQPAAVVPMRLNQHGLSGLVMLEAGQSAPTFVAQDIDPANIFTVTNTLDSASIGADPPTGSLRWAINKANSVASSGPAEILFNIPTSDPNYNSGTGVYLIRPLSEDDPGSGDAFALPAINNTVTIDGYSQPGASPNTLATGSNAKIAIQIDGSLATTPGGSGLSPYFDVGSTFRGMSFTGWTNVSISGSVASGAEGMEANGVGDYIEGNYFGLDPTGAINSNRIGIFGDDGPGFASTLPGNIIGGTTPQARNVITGNAVGNVLLLSTCVECQVIGNYIGTDPTGSTLPPGANSNDGVGTNGPTMAIGSPEPGAGNLISGNEVNVDLNDLTNGGVASNSSVEGNFIGTDATGKVALLSSNNYAGVSLQHNVTYMQIGGPGAGARNVISGNLLGVLLVDTANHNTVENNYVGTDVSGSAALGNATNGITLQPDSNNDAGTGSVLNTITGNVVSGNAADGIHIAGTATEYTPYATYVGNTITANLIGTDAGGTASLGNANNGIYLDAQATANQIGGGSLGAGNTVAYNGKNGVYEDTGGTDGGLGAHNAVVSNTIVSNTGAGVFLNSGIDNSIRYNQVYANGALGIDLAPAGHNPINACGATPSGPNNGINAPVLTGGGTGAYISATATDSSGDTSEFSNIVQATGSGSLLTLLGSYTGAANSTFTLDFFQSATPDASGFGQGQTYIGSVTVTTDGNCNGTVNQPVDLADADVSVSLSSSGNLLAGPDFGDNVYTAVLTNNGAATAHSVVFTDALPTGVTVSSLYCNTAACQSPVTTTAGTCSVSGSTVTCNIPALPAGNNATVSIPVHIPTASSVTNTVTVSAQETDPNRANNTSSVTDQVTYPFPFIDHLNPGSALVNQSGGVLLGIYAAGVLPQTQVTFNGTSVPVVDIIDNQYCNSQNVVGYCAELRVNVPQSLLSTAGTPTVELTNPDPGEGGGSNIPSDANFTIASSCTFTTDLDYLNVEAGGTDLLTSPVNVTPSAPSCTWSASSSVDWMQVVDYHNFDASYANTNIVGTGPIAGTGGVDFAIAPNTGTSSRSGDITVAGYTQTFTQPAGGTCAYSLASTSANLPYSGGSGQVAVTSNCTAYYVQSPESWVTIPPLQGLLSGNATASYTVAANTGAPRVSNLTIGGVVYTINQAAPPCYYTLSSTAATVPAGGETGSFTVTASAPSCSYSIKASDPSVSITSGGSATGNTTVNYSVAANTGGVLTPTITVSDGTGSSVFSITQASDYSCAFTLSPSSIEVPTSGYSNFIALNVPYSFCKWNAATNNPDAVVLTQATSGSGSSALYYSVGQNTSTSPRTLTITAGCDTFTITQDGAGTTATTAPTLTTLSPSTVTAGSGAFTLTLTGTGFVSGATANFNGTAEPTTFVSATQLTAAIPASAVATAANVPVTVTNPNSGGTSGALTFTITAATTPAPTLTALTPNSATAGSGAFTLALTGTNFTSGSAVAFNGAAVPTTFVSATQLTAAIPASAVATAGNVPVTVTNANGGGTSNALNFTITTATVPAPTLTVLSPTSVPAGSGAFTLMLTGTNFTSDAAVTFGGAAVPTTYISATQLTAAIPAGAVATAGTSSVTVANSGGTSGALTFTVTAASAPGATLTPGQLTFASTTVGSSAAAQQLTLTNPGTAPLTITGITLTGSAAASYMETNTCGSSLAAGATCTVSVTFTPATTGTLTATLSVADNASGSPQTASLTGTGAAATTPSFTLTTTGSPQTVGAGGAAQFTVTVAATGGTFANAVALAASGLPPGAIATFAPASVTPGSSSASSTLTVQTASTTAAASPGTLWALALSGTPLLLLSRRMRRRWATLAVLLGAALGAAGALSGCGGGFGYHTGAGGTTYTLTITGTSGSVQQTSSVQLTVR